MRKCLQESLFGRLRGVGVAFQNLDGSEEDGAENIGYIIPTEILRHFLEDFKRREDQLFSVIKLIKRYIYILVSFLLNEFK